MLKLNVKTLSLVLFLSFLLTTQTLQPIFAESPRDFDQPNKKVTFRLLAIEANFNKTPLEKAQSLIRNLRLFSNWRNGSTGNFQYFSYIHLLSNVNYEQIDPECQPYYKGNATRENILKEITSFLNQPQDNASNIITVLYYVGNSERDFKEGNTSLYMVLDKPLFDWELHNFLYSSQPQKPMLIILDTPYGGGYIETLKKKGRVILTACNPAEETTVGWFTGCENASYPNGTSFGPLGIIGATLTASDINQDGWLSADEIFRFSQKTLINFALNQTSPQQLHPWACYGIAGGALPLVTLDETKPYPSEGRFCPPRIFLPNSRYNKSQMECPTYRNSLTRIGFAQTVGIEIPEVLWVLTLNTSIKSSPVIADGIVYVTTVGGEIYALDLETGKEIWTFDTNCSISSTPTVDKNIIIFGTEAPGKIYALDAYTGLLRWLFELPESVGVRSSPAITEGRVLIGSSDGYLRCFSQFEGYLLWATYIGGDVSSPAVANDTVYVTALTYVSALNVSTGALKWRYATNWPLFSSPAIADNLVFVGAENDDKVFALKQENGSLVWSFRTGGWLTSPAVDSQKKLVIVGCRDARTYCLDEFTGYLKWQFISAPNHKSAPTISEDGLVYFGTTDGYLYCLKEDNGQEVWRYNVGSPIVSSPLIIYEHVIVTSEDGKLLFLGPPFHEHNIAISQATVSPSTVKVGEWIEVNVTIANKGDVKEKIAITISFYGSKTVIKNFTNINGNIAVSSGENLTSTLHLNTTKVLPGYYLLVFEAQLVPDETEALDNIFVVEAVRILALEDLNGDGQINIIDVSMVARAFGTMPGDPDWKSICDVNNDNVINILDIYLIAKAFGENYN